jgi:Phosphatidylserine/phosphatidylglycerophosphate/cardiolipin synthases and related enzymes
MAFDLRQIIISTIRYGEMEEKAKAELLELMKYTSACFARSDEWSGYHAMWHKKEYVELRIIPEKMEELRKYKSELDFFCGQIYKDNDHYTYEGILIKPGNIDSVQEDTKREVLFDDIQKRIIDEIRDAKYVIWIAMAWFNNEVIYKELLKKKAEGLSIVIIIDRNEINANAKFDLFKNFEAYSMKMPTKFNNTMHNKFCIIDLKTVIHGTFNWTNAANFNAETIDVTNDDRALAEQFSSEFLELKREAIKQMITSVF